MHTKEFLVFKDRLIEYLRNFIKGLQRNVGVIEENLRLQSEELKKQVFEKVIDYELSIPRMEIEVSKEMIEQKIIIQVRPPCVYYTLISFSHLREPLHTSSDTFQKGRLK